MADPVPTYYDVLQVERDASADRVRAAYRKLAQKYHPDKMPGNANASRAMAAINAAYEVLSDGHRRAEHDLWIRRAERGASASATPSTPLSLWGFLHPARNWAWYLLGGTMVFAVGTITTALYLTSMPARAATPVAESCKLEATAPRCSHR
ncbi:J domain-containing protein [Ramlibacter terrae]|uniref:J domain-containing protein n=1 Tax=Ramlibacter terrae TaxID=2732511 RepID=A0ABX6P4S6_9BURK|nr:J domain-containing protein [Ramlibacter terrae]